MPQDIDPAHVAQALTHLRNKGRQYKDAKGHKNKRAARATLHEAITLAVRAGARQVQAAQASGLSKAQVSRIARGASSGRTSLPPVQYLVDTLPADELIQRYQAGESARELGAAFGCSRHTIYAVLESREVPRDHPAGRPQVGLPEAEIVERLERGESARGIGRAYGVSYMTVLRRARQDPTGRCA